MIMKLAGKVALITGAASGIGRASAFLFAREGATIVAADIDAAGAQATATRIREDGGQAIAVAGDVSVAGDAERMVAASVEACGGLHVLFNNAGIFRHGTVVETEEAEWDRVLAVNLKGVFLVSKYVLPHMIAGGGGTVVNTASTAGVNAFYNQAAYDASKGGVVLLSKQMALDYARYAIRVNCLVPGLVDTAQSRGAIAALGDPVRGEELWAKITGPIGRVGTAEELAKAALFLASDDSSYMTGASLIVDGGLTAG
jgi:NAD(P)-dependent dehydrogenase (short-subunit alcohol dehydrogenase family)